MQGIGHFGDPRAAWVHAGDDITPEPQPVKYKTHEVTTLHCTMSRKGQSHPVRLDAQVISLSYLSSLTAQTRCLELQRMVAQGRQQVVSGAEEGLHGPMLGFADW